MLNSHVFLPVGFFALQTLQSMTVMTVIDRWAKRIAWRVSSAVSLQESKSEIPLKQHGYVMFA